MPNFSPILCDGCGQPASPQHLAKRFQRLEWATRYRPIHLHTLLLGAASPQLERAFLYSPDPEATGEAASLLQAAGIPGGARTVEALHAEFQRRGVYLAHVVECPLESGTVASLSALLVSRLPALFTRIRRSLRPKRIVLIARELEPLLSKFDEAKLGCELVLDGGRSFELGGSGVSEDAQSMARFKKVLAGEAGQPVS